MISFIAKIISSPLVSTLLIPALKSAIRDFLMNQADKIEQSIAIKAAKAAKTSEELREASKKLTSITRR